VRPTLRLRVTGGTLHAELRRRAIVIWAGEAAFSNADELSAAIGALVVEAPALRLSSMVEVNVEPPLVQLRTLTDLPPVRPRALAALVAHQPARFFRKNGKPLVTDAVWIGARRLRWRRPMLARSARAAAIELPWVEAIVLGLRQAGLPAPAISAGAVGEGARMDLLPAAERAARRRQRVGLTRRLAFMAFALWLGVAALYVGRLAVIRRRLGAESARLHNASEAVIGARRALHETDAMVAAVETQSLERQLVLRQLGKLLTTLPDSTYLTSLELTQDGSGMMTGGARRAAELVAALDRGGIVANPRLEGAPLPEVANGRRAERFTLRFGRGAPR
jgi:hypothetical protein